MEIYIHVCSRDDGSCAWYNKTNKEAYLTDGSALWCYDPEYGEYMRGTPFKTIADAKRAGKDAKDLAAWNGMVDPKVSYWRMKNGKLIETKFTRDNKIKN